MASQWPITPGPGGSDASPLEDLRVQTTEGRTTVYSLSKAGYNCGVQRCNQQGFTSLKIMWSNFETQNLIICSHTVWATNTRITVCGANDMPYGNWRPPKFKRHKGFLAVRQLYNIRRMRKSGHIL